MNLRPLVLCLGLYALPFANPALAAGGAGAEQSGPTSGLAMAMTIYAGGITLGKVDMDAKFIGDNYHVVSNLETSGVVNAFWQSTIQATSSGKLDGKVLQPSTIPSTPDTPKNIRKFRSATKTARPCGCTPIRPTP